MSPDVPGNNSAAPMSQNSQSNQTAGKSEFTEFSDRPGFNFAVAICWVVAIIAILGTVFFWFMDQNSASQIQVNAKKKADILSQLNTPSYIDIENKANDFKSSVNALSSAEKSRYSVSTFLKTLYTKVTNDVTLTSISVSSEGSLSLAGTTVTYRSVADLMMALKSWDVLQNVDLSSVSNQKDEKTGKIVTTFSITAKVNKSTTSATTGATASKGGTQ